MDKNGDTLSEAILRWLEDNPSWWSRSEIATGLGRKKTSQFIRALHDLVTRDLVAKCQATEHGRSLFLYTLNANPSDFELPF